MMVIFVCLVTIGIVWSLMAIADTSEETLRNKEAALLREREQLKETLAKIEESSLKKYLPTYEECIAFELTLDQLREINSRLKDIENEKMPVHQKNKRQRLRKYRDQFRLRSDAEQLGTPSVAEGLLWTRMRSCWKRAMEFAR